MDQWKKDLLRLYCEANARLNPRLRKLYRRALATGDWKPLQAALHDHQADERREAERVKASWAEFAALWNVKGNPHGM